jgi:ligand-binding sensor domain-containing protein/serine phosphatase RsbU (regulator of sigma subunit)
MRRLLPILIVISGLLSSSPSSAEESEVLARVGVRILPRQKKVFAKAFYQDVPRILESLGFTVLADRPEDRRNSVTLFVQLDRATQINILRQALNDSEAFAAFRDRHQNRLGNFLYRVHLHSATVKKGQRQPARMMGTWRNYGIADGIPGTEITGVVQDAHRRLWVGSLDGGLFRFDGQTFEHFSEIEPRVRAVGKMQDGRIILGTDDGVSLVDPSTLDVVRHTKRVQVTSVYCDPDGLLWIGTAVDGLLTLDEASGTWTTAGGLPAKRIRDVTGGLGGNVWVATSQGLAHYRAAEHLWQIWDMSSGLPSEDLTVVLGDERASVWVGTADLGLFLFDAADSTVIDHDYGLRWLGGVRVHDIARTTAGETWASVGARLTRVERTASGFDVLKLRAQDGPPDLEARTLGTDDEGHLWMGSSGIGLARFSGYSWMRFGMTSGNATGLVSSVSRDNDGVYWFGTGSGVARHVPGPGRGEWSRFTLDEGLPSNRVMTVGQDSSGSHWIGTTQGLVRYEDGIFRNYTEMDLGFPVNVSAFHVDRSGNVWAGVRTGRILRRDRKSGEWSHRYLDRGSVVTDVLEDASGNLRFATWNGVWQLDTSVDPEIDISSFARGQAETSGSWTQLSQRDGLADSRITTIAQDDDGNIWYGHPTSGLSVYRTGRGKWDYYTTKDGLCGNRVSDIMVAESGQVWIGTERGGASVYDGTTFQTIRHEDGLGADAVSVFYEDPDGTIWGGTPSGVVRLRKPESPVPPTIQLINVETEREVRSASTVSMSSRTPSLSINLGAISYKTRPEGMVFRYRLAGLDGAWQTTNERSIQYRGLPIGDYLFEVQAVDRDLVYSEVADLNVHVHLPYGDIALKGSLGVAIVALVVVSGVGYRRRRQQFVEMQRELQTAHDLQMSLMPTDSPSAPNLDMAGRCLPAGHVGGDFFQYYEREGVVSVAMADVTGHAMGAAIPGAMFSGVLKSRMERNGSLRESFNDLNATLFGTLSGHTLICLAVGEFDLNGSNVRICDCGCPYPLHFRADDRSINEIVSDGFPLGAAADPDYQEVRMVTAPGDYVVFCSDGIVETRDRDGGRIGFEKTAEIVRTVCARSLDAADTTEAIISEVDAFRDGAEQQDDVTCVVVRFRPEPEADLG